MRRRPALVCWLLFAAGIVSSPGGAVSLALVPSTLLAPIGSSFTVDVTIAGLAAPGPPSLRSFDLDVTFAAALVSFDGLDFGPHLGSPPTTAIAGFSYGGGLVDLFEVSLLSTPTLETGQPASFVLATLHFTALAEGVASFGLSQLDLADAVGAPIVPSSVNGGDVPIVVPEPGSAALLLLGGVLLASLRRRGGAALLLVALLASLTPRASEASCNLIPVAGRSFASELGVVSRPVAAPGDSVTLTTNPVCEPGQPLFADPATDNAVVLRFEPPGGGPTTDVAVPGGSLSVAQCGGGDCARLSFPIPDTDADLPPLDGNGLAGPARILVSRDGGATPVAEVGAIFEPTLGCDEQPEAIFEHFTVLPAPNDFAALVAGTATTLRATLDGGDNLIVPFDYGDALTAPPGSPIFSILEATVSNVEAFTGGALLRLPPTGAIRSFTKIGRPIPPLLRVDAEGDTIFGSADARHAILRIQRVNPGNPDFYDFTDRLLGGRGPVLIPVDEALVRSPAPLPSLQIGAQAVAFALDEADEGELNFDGDAVPTDLVPQILDPASTTGTDTQLAADEVSWPGFEKPALASAGGVVALYESEARNGEIDYDLDLDSDHRLRVYDAAGNERTAGWTIFGDPKPVLDGKPLVVQGDLVFFRSRESDDAARQTRRVLTDGSSFNGLTVLSQTGRFLAVETITLLTAVPDGNAGGARDVYRIDRDSDADGIFDEPGATGVELVSIAASGLASGNGEARYPALSADGRHVAFQSNATDLVGGSMSAIVRVFVRDMQTGTTRLASTPDGVTPSNGAALFPSISDDGRFVAFFSRTASNMGVGSGGAIVVVDRDTDGDGIFDEAGAVGIDRRLSRSGGSGDGSPALSGDGRTVAFCSQGTFFGQPNTVAATEVWVYGPHGTRRLPTLDGLEPDRASCEIGTVPLAISSDGRFVAFPSRASNLVGIVADVHNMYVYDYEADRVELVSVSTDGTTSIGTGTQSEDPSISDDGRFVTFASSTDLTASASGTALGFEVYLYDRATNTIEIVSRNDAGQLSDAESNEAGISGDGRHVVFHSAADNLDGAANGLFGRGHDPDADGNGALDAGISLNAADGDATDTVLQVFDAQGATLRPNARVPASVVALAAGRAAVLTPESEDGAGAGASNGDADTADLVAQVYDGGTDSVTSLDVAAARIALSSQVVCLAVPESGQPGASNGDADSDDHLLAYWRIGEPVGSLVITSHSVYSFAPTASLAALGDHCLFVSYESDSAGTPGLVSNGAPLDDLVLGVFDTQAGSLWSPSGPAAAEIVVGDSAVLAAFRSCEAAEGASGVILNGDGDAVDCVMRVLDVTGGTPAIVDTGRAARPCTFPACNPFFEPYRVRGNAVSFLSREGDQSGPGAGTPLHCAPTGTPGECDFSGDGDADDSVIQVFNVRAETVQSFPIVETKPPGVPPFPESVDEKTSLTMQIPESVLGEDVDEDGFVTDDLVVVILGDADEDGALDGSVETAAAGTGLADNCFEVGNATQLDFDGDRLGDQACDPFPFSGLLLCDVDGNAQVDRDDVQLITDARGQTVTETDLRDPNQSGTIDVYDAAFCAHRCSFDDCARTGGCGLGFEVALALAVLRGLRRGRPGPSRRRRGSATGR
jgi:Tol biopolymer transport system component